MTVDPVRRSVNQMLLACDDQGRFTGQYVRRDAAHAGDGHRHLAIALLLYNRAGELLLQRRKHDVFDDVWDITGATHPLLLADGMHESLEQAARRCLQDEYGIGDARLAEVGSFTYFALDQTGIRCENEHCTLFIGEFNGAVTLNQEVGYGSRWVTKAFLAHDITLTPDRYSPWAVLSVDLLRHTGFLP